jgi:predicted nucleic acid-binding protein
MRVLLDTNILLDSLLQRAPWNVEADAILRQAKPGTLELSVAALSLANLFYIGRRIVGTEQARADVRRVAQTFNILAVDRSTILQADALPGSDFEDNIQIAAATNALLTAIISRDPNGFAASPIPVWSPAELLKQIASSSDPQQSSRRMT